MKRWCLITGLLLLALAWFAPLPARSSFAMHMALHMLVVAVAAPLIAAGIAGGPFDPARRWPRGWIATAWWPLLASAVEFVVVWGWHVPALHLLARNAPLAYVLEQGSFLGAGLLLWLAALGQGADASRQRAGAGALALLLTATHMTLLGVLLATATRTLYDHAGMPAALWHQQLGGVLMLAIGGIAYLAGALVLLRRMLHERSAEAAA